MGVLITILALSFVIFIHECGHLFFAKWGGIGVIEFSIGMGPKLFGFYYKGTYYKLRALPVGGFVKLAGLDNDGSSIYDAESYFQNRPMRWRFLTILAGSLMNILLGFFIFYVLILLFGIMSLSPIVESTVPDGPAAVAGIRSGDVITGLNGVSIDDVNDDFIKHIQSSKEEIQIQISRNGVSYSYGVVPYFEQEYDVYRVGIQFALQHQRINPIGAIFNASKMTAQAISLVGENFSLLFGGKASFKDMSGPVGIVQIASFQFSENIKGFFNLIALISITLGLINLLPFPVLDGGHLIFLTYESVFRKPVSPKLAMLLINVFAMILILLMVGVFYNDFKFWSERTEMLEAVFRHDKN